MNSFYSPQAQMFLSPRFYLVLLLSLADMQDFSD
jgi:hypothetical protein